MTTPIKWKSSVAREVWKVIICTREAERVTEVLQSIAYIVGGPGHRTEQECSDLLSPLSGAEIVQALLAYQECNAESVARAVREVP